MVSRFITRVFTGGYSFLDDLCEVPPFGVPKQFLEIARTPEFRIGLWESTNYLLETRVQTSDKLFVHVAPPYNMLRLFAAGCAL